MLSFPRLAVVSIISRLNYSSKAHDLSGYRSLIKVRGQDAVKYLQNLITNDMNALNKVSVIYAMMLNNRGRILYDTIVYKLSNLDDNYLIEADSKFTEQMMKLLKTYKIKKKVDIEIVDSEFRLFSVNGDFDHSSIEKNQNIVACVQDPRSSDLGHRIILKIDKNKDTQLLSAYLSNVEDVPKESNLTLYKQNLYRHGVAENNSDISYSNSIPLEYNLVLMNGVSFSKGCYLGQELIAKTHHTGVIRKRITPIVLKENDLNDKIFEQDSLILNTKTGKTVGKLRGLSGIYGIALLKMEYLSKNSMVLIDNVNKQHPIEFNIPNYWKVDEILLKNLNDLKLL